MRIYPAGMRIDSSNFNPIPMWACGIQLTALNYQTEGTRRNLYIIMPSVCLCATEVRTLYGLRLPAPEVGGVRSLHATQLGATGGLAHPVGAFSTAGARRVPAFLHYSSSHNRAKCDCSLYLIMTAL